MDTKYQRAKIVVEELRKLYLQILLFIGLFIFIIFKSFYSGSYGLNEFTPSLVNSSSIEGAMIFQSPLFIISYIGAIFFIILLYKYLKIHLLKNKFNDKEKGNEKLKKYMKIDKIPKKEEVDNKFVSDKKILGTKFYLRISYIIFLVISLIIINTYYFKLVFLDILILFVILNLFYRYIFLTHMDKKIFNKEWENKKIKKYIDEYKFNETSK